MIAQQLINYSVCCYYYPFMWQCHMEKTFQKVSVVCTPEQSSQPLSIESAIVMCLYSISLHNKQLKTVI